MTAKFCLSSRKIGGMGNFIEHAIPFDNRNIKPCRTRHLRIIGRSISVPSAVCRHDGIKGKGLRRLHPYERVAIDRFSQSIVNASKCVDNWQRGNCAGRRFHSVQ